MHAHTSRAQPHWTLLATCLQPTAGCKPLEPARRAKSVVPRWMLTQVGVAQIFETQWPFSIRKGIKRSKRKTNAMWRLPSYSIELDTLGGKTYSANWKHDLSNQFGNQVTFPWRHMTYGDQDHPTKSFFLKLLGVLPGLWSTHDVETLENDVQLVSLPRL